MSARELDYADQLFGRVRGVLERAEWGTKAERTNVAWAILDEVLKIPTDAPRLAFARALAAAAGYAVVPVKGDGVWFLNAADPEYGHGNLCEMLDDQREDLVEVQHATIVRRTWHVRLDDEENGREWREFASEAEAGAMIAAAKEGQG